MRRRDVDPGSGETNPVDSRLSAGHVRFRTESEMGLGALQRRWQATHSSAKGWSCFKITIDLDRHRCTLGRVPETDYSALLRDLAGKTDESLTPLPPPPRRVESLTFDIDIIGLKMSQVTPRAAARGGPAGDWLVVQAYLPGSTESFLLGVSNRFSAGEIVVPKPESGRAVIQALSQVFG
ncbi:MAG: hypothetical protein PVI01_13055 [Gemmatimonadales bacterium]|jgi:hypothetical protein